MRSDAVAAAPRPRPAPVDITGERIEIACNLVAERDKSVIIADGTKEQVRNSETGVVTEREKRFYLPRQYVEWIGPHTIRIPEWLARDRGLI